jgi:hypothetical protein
VYSEKGGIREGFYANEEEIRQVKEGRADNLPKPLEVKQNLQLRTQQIPSGIIHSDSTSVNIGSQAEFVIEDLPYLYYLKRIYSSQFGDLSLYNLPTVLEKYLFDPDIYGLCLP